MISCKSDIHEDFRLRLYVLRDVFLNPPTVQRFFHRSDIGKASHLYDLTGDVYIGPFVKMFSHRDYTEKVFRLYGLKDDFLNC